MRRFRRLCSCRRPDAIRWINVILLVNPSMIPLLERCRMERTLGSHQHLHVPAIRCRGSWALRLARSISCNNASRAGFSSGRSHPLRTSGTQSSTARRCGKRRP
jgi:hypothetical protein